VAALGWAKKANRPGLAWTPGRGEELASRRGVMLRHDRTAARPRNRTGLASPTPTGPVECETRVVAACGT
jgi:hypothetical protein